MNELKTNHNQMPAHIESEQAVLGCALSGSKYFTIISPILQVEDFLEPKHQMIYTAILRLYMQNRSIDALTVAEELKKENQLEKIGGLPYLNFLPDTARFLSSAEEYAKIVHEKSMLRQLLYVSEEIRAACFEQKEEADVLIEHAEKKFYDIKQGKNLEGPVPVHQIIQSALEELSDLKNRKNKTNHSGFIELDKVLGGLKKGTLNILAARPAMGKSALALNIARNMAINQKVVVVFSLEMSKEEIALRLFSSEAMVESKEFQNPHFFDKNENKLSTALMMLNQNCKLFVDDKAGTSALDILSRCRQIKMQYGLDCVIIDYLQLMSSSKRNGSENRQQEISEISRSLKLMAKDLEVPILALSQLSRACELRADKRPLLSDLRESGSIEQDADAVLFLYRPMYYASEKEKAEQKDTSHENVELIVAKNRGGETKTLQLGWIPRYVKFFDFHLQALQHSDPLDSLSDEDFASLESMAADFGKEEEVFILD